ncbi:MAG TPA: hypothetical protein VLM38_05265 [Blastocatellia bacterium]|nr:hypothetical protein [Blastocatellia bacterium]
MRLRAAVLSSRLFAVGLLLSLFVPAIGAQDLPRSFQELLQRRLRVTEQNIASLEDGGTVTRVLTTKEKKEVAALGIVRVDASAELFIQEFRDIVNFKKSSSVVQIGKFSNPPRLEDLNGLTLDPCCLDAITNCETGKCAVQMSGEMMERFRDDRSLYALDNEARANSLARRILVDYVKAYLQAGNPALIEYHDQENKVRLAEEYRSLLEQSRFLTDFAPEFYKYLEDFPKANSPNVEDFIYWSKEKFGPKPVLSITHVAIYKRNVGNRTEVLIASKQLYANHYFDASLGLTAFVEGNDGAGSCSYLLYLNRSRIGALRGFFVGLKRSVIEARIRQGMGKNLNLIKRRLTASMAALSVRSPASVKASAKR